MQPPASEHVLFQGSDFAEWASLNDTIMGGNSRAGCRTTVDGLLLEGQLVEAGGGFVSCRSPRLQPPLNLSPFSALQINLDGEGRTLKIALGCRDGAMGLTELIPGGVRWVIDVPTQAEGTTRLTIPFSDTSHHSCETCGTSSEVRHRRNYPNTGSPLQVWRCWRPQSWFQAG